MVDLIAKTAAQDLLPLTIGQVQVVEVSDMPMATLAPYKGVEGDAAKAFKKAHKLNWPAPNAATGKGPMAIWFGQAHIMLMGALPADELSESCAVVDQSDAWTVVDVTGAHSADVLARLTPIDLRDDAFPVGATARTELQHMQSSITRIASDQYRVVVFRSMAKTLVHDLQQAMEQVSALSDA